MTESLSSVPKDRGLSAILEACRSAARRFVGRVAKRRDVDDVLRDAFTRSYAASRAAVRHPRAFLLRTANHLSINGTRAGTCPSAGPDESPMAEIFAQLANEAMEAQIDASQRFTLFCRAIGSLPEDSRRAFVLKKVYGLPQHEIAERLGVSPAEVERLIARGLLLCRDYMEAMGAAHLAGGPEPRKTSPGQRR